MKESQKTWQDIWEQKNTKKQLSALDNYNEVLDELLILTGFDSKSATGIDSASHMDFTRQLYSLAELEKCESVYEVGCGCGSFLYSLSAAKQQIKTNNMPMGGGA